MTHYASEPILGWHLALRPTRDLSDITEGSAAGVVAGSLYAMRLATGSIIDETPAPVIEWGQESGIIWIGAVLAVLLLLHLLASWAEKKGWIYYRREGGNGRGAALSNALTEFEAVLNPAAEHRIVEERSQAILRSEIGQSLGDEESDYYEDTRSD